MGKNNYAKYKFSSDYARELFEQKKPSSNREEILLALIDCKNVTGIHDFSYMAGFRTRISELKKELIPEGVRLTTTTHTGYNKFGNSYVFAKHTIDGSELTLNILKKLYLKYEK